MLRKHIAKTALFISVLIVAMLQYGTASAKLTIKANHDHITVNYNYHGSTVSVKGESDPGVDIIVTLTSSENAHQSLKQKNKVGGIIWMNTATVTLEDLPNVYLQRSSKAPEGILSQEQLESNAIGYDALLHESEISPAANDEEKESLFKDFVKYKEANKLYSVMDGDVTLKEENGVQEYYTLVKWPYQAPPGDYSVNVYAVRDGKVMEKAQAAVLVERIGLVKSLTNMAQNNGALYGIIAILIALAAGFGVGLVFRKSGGAH
jgi:uncharacterized protein (TIGR02186 family)